jgi:hypothetical protein
MGSMALQLKFPKLEGPLESYQKALTLRSLMDERRYRQAQHEAQTRSQELLAQQREQELTERRNLSRLFGGPTEPTEQEIISASPQFGIPIVRERRQAQAAAAQAKSAGATEERTRQQITIDRMPLILNRVKALMRLPSWADRYDLAKQDTPDFFKAGVITKEEADNVVVDDETLDRMYTALGGLDLPAFKGEIAAEAEKRATAARAAEKADRETRHKNAEQWFPFVKDQASWDNFKTSFFTPAEQANMPKEYSQENMQAMRQTFLTEQQRQTQAPPITPYQEAALKAQAEPKTLDQVIIAMNQPDITPERKAQLDKTRQSIIAAHQVNRAQEQGLSPRQFQATQSLARQYDNSPIVKTFNDVFGRYETVKGILNKPSLGGTGDLAVIFEWMHGVEPDSVVRSDEFDRVAKSGNIFRGAMAKFNGYLKPEGGFLPPEVKKNFLEILEQKLNVHRRKAKILYDEYGRRIDLITGKPGTGTGYVTNYSGIFDDQGTDKKDPMGIR